MCPIQVLAHLCSTELLTNEKLVKFHMPASGQITTEGCNQLGRMQHAKQETATSLVRAMDIFLQKCFLILWASSRLCVVPY